MDEIREQYQKETESLKADHSLHTQDMQAEFQSQLHARETELRADFDKQMGMSQLIYQFGFVFYFWRTAV